MDKPYGTTRAKRTKKNLFSYIEEKGLAAEDIGKAILCHEILGFTMLALTWSYCFYFPPSQNRFLREPVAKLLSLVPNKMSSAVSSNPFLGSQAGSAYIESSCIRKMIRPITIPMKLYLSVKIVQALPRWWAQPSTGEASKHDENKNCATEEVRSSKQSPKLRAVSVARTGYSSRANNLANSIPALEVDSVELATLLGASFADSVLGTRKEFFGGENFMRSLFSGTGLI